MTVANVSVVTGRKVTDITVPADMPIKEWIDEAVSVLSGRIHKGDDIGFEFDTDGTWTLALMGAPPIERGETLDGADVVDGDLVRLVAVSHTERYRPLVEDTIDAIAVLDPSPVFGREDVTRWLSGLIVAVALGVSGLGVAGWSSGAGQQRWWGPALLALALGVGGVGYFVWQRYAQALVAQSLLVASVVLLVTGAGLSVPLPRDADWLGAANLAAAGFALLAAAVVVRGGPLRHSAVAAAAGTVGLVTGVAAIAMGYGLERWTWPALVAVGLLLFTNADKLTILCARIALPPIPAPGESVDVEELLEPVVDAAAESSRDPNENSWRAVLESVPSSSARLVERAELTGKLLAGFTAAGAAVTAVGAVGLLQQGHFFVHTMVLACFAAMACVFRSRFHARPVCAAALLSAAAAIVLGCAGKMVWWDPACAPWAAAVVVALTAAALLVFAARRDARRLNPRAKQLLERIDGLVVAAMPLLLLWVAGLYDLLRNITSIH